MQALHELGIEPNFCAEFRPAKISRLEGIFVQSRLTPKTVVTPVAASRTHFRAYTSRFFERSFAGHYRSLRVRSVRFLGSA
jgi:hypothetical protein